jgi:predicted small lipoprotein YifL
MRTLFAAVAAALLAACGADGPPERPQPPAAEPDVTVTGQVRLGVRL